MEESEKCSSLKCSPIHPTVLHCCFHHRNSCYQQMKEVNDPVDDNHRSNELLDFHNLQQNSKYAVEGIHELHQIWLINGWINKTNIKCINSIICTYTETKTSGSTTNTLPVTGNRTGNRTASHTPPTG